MFDFFGVLVLLLLLLFFAWLAARAGRTRRALLRWFGAITAGLLSLLFGILLGAALFGYWTLNRSYDNPVSQSRVEVTPERVARGAQFEPICSGCHAPDAEAAMIGSDFLGDDAPPIGRFHAPNLTPTHLADWSDGEIVRAIREGIHRSGRSLLIMPSDFFYNLSDEDVFSIVTYLRSLQPEGVDTPPNRLNVLGAIMAPHVSILQAQPPITEPVLTPSAGPTAEYGAYLTSFTCNMCHGASLSGDTGTNTPSLLAIPIAWGEQRFIHFMRSGIRPDGSEVDGEAMPWNDLSRLFGEDDDLRAIFAHLQEEFEKLGH